MHFIDRWETSLRAHFILAAQWSVQNNTNLRDRKRRISLHCVFLKHIYPVSTSEQTSEIVHFFTIYRYIDSNLLNNEIKQLENLYPNVQNTVQF